MNFVAFPLSYLSSVWASKANGAVHRAIGIEGSFQHPLHTNLPLCIFLHGFSELGGVPNGIQWVQAMVLANVVAGLET